MMYLSAHFREAQKCQITYFNVKPVLTNCQDRFLCADLSKHSSSHSSFSASIKISLALIFSASAILYRTLTVGLRNPSSILLKWLRSIFARPLNTSCESRCFSRKRLITTPIVLVPMRSPPIDFYCTSM